MTSTDLATAAGAADWEKILPTIRHMFAKGATDPEFQILCMTAKKLGLDPSLKQIWCVKNLNRPDDPAQIYASRDGLLAIAHRSGQFDGMESGVRKNADGEEVGFCRIWRKDMSHPFEAEILRSEYDLKRNLWASKPQTMTVKVAEAHCLRRAFDIQGVYTPDEMPEQEPSPYRAGSVPAEVVPPKAPPNYSVIPDSSTNAEVSESTNPGQISSSAPATPVETCDICCRSTADLPAMRIVVRDGKRICGSCLRKAEKAETEPAPAPAKAVPKPPAKVAAPVASGAVCADCGRAVEASEEKTSRLFVSRVLCRGCLEHVNGPQPGEERA